MITETTQGFANEIVNELYVIYSLMLRYKAYFLDMLDTGDEE